MLTVIIIMTAGMVLGFIIREKEKLIKLTEPLITVSIFALLFLLGVSVGTNQTILENLDTIGLKAAILTFGAVSGSIALAFFIDMMFFRKDEK